MNYFETRFDFEWKIVEFFNSLSSTILDTFVLLISFFGSGAPVIGLVLFLYYAGNKEFAKKLFFVISTSLMLNGILKTFFFAKRPFQFIGKQHVQKAPKFNGAEGTSFPSGHSQMAGSFYLSYFLNTHKTILKVLSIFFLITIPLSRLYLGVHFFMDSIIGLLLGLVVAIVVQKIYDKLGNNGRMYVLMITCFIGLIFCIFNMNIVENASLFKTVGLVLGMTVGILIEESRFNYTNKVPLLNKILRCVIGAVVCLTLKEGFKLILPDHNIFHFIRYFLISFIAIGVIPMFFKKEENNGKHNIL